MTRLQEDKETVLSVLRDGPMIGGMEAAEIVLGTGDDGPGLVDVLDALRSLELGGKVEVVRDVAGEPRKFGLLEKGAKTTETKGVREANLVSL